jgi:hypothetical protein
MVPIGAGRPLICRREGCAIRSTTPVQKGDYLRLLIFSSNHECPIEVGLAPVRWATNEEFGVEFIMVAPQDVNRIKDYLTLREDEPVGQSGTVLPE